MSESVWDYPRPPRVEPTRRRIRAELGGSPVLDTVEAVRVLETSHPPVYYVLLAAFADGALVPSPGGGSVCEWKGAARYFDILGGEGRRAERAAWGYPRPAPGYEALIGRVAVYPSAMDRCTVDGEEVQGQPGDFYGGWITAGILGPFKGPPGTAGW